MENKITYWNYKEIQKESHRIDCTIYESDFNTRHPDRSRIDRFASEINRHKIQERVIRYKPIRN